MEKPAAMMVNERGHSNLPADFEPALYLDLNPDVAKANADPVKHYLAHGIEEGRKYKREPQAVLSIATSGVPGRFCANVPSAQNVIVIFDGERSCAMPATSGPELERFQRRL